jgi:NADP-dependent 3-hydroxy acid dehydrogenase YdfG
VKGQLIVLHVDLSSFASVRKFAEEFSELENKLHILINNAGFAFHPLRKITEDGIEQVKGGRNTALEFQDKCPVLYLYLQVLMCRKD